MYLSSFVMRLNSSEKANDSQMHLTNTKLRHLAHSLGGRPALNMLTAPHGTLGPHAASELEAQLQTQAPDAGGEVALGTVNRWHVTQSEMSARERRTAPGRRVGGPFSSSFEEMLLPVIYYYYFLRLGLGETI